MDDFGMALQVIRNAAGLTLAQLASAMPYTKGHISNVESGARQPTAEFAASADRALGTAPLFTMMADDPGGSAVKRRALLESVGLTLGAGLTIGSVDLAEVVRHAMASHAGNDWAEVVDDLTRRFVAEPSDALLGDVLGQIMILRQEIKEQSLTSDRARASAALCLLFGLLRGNRGDLRSARGWYNTAGMMAERSGDPETVALVAGRAASRGSYEGHTVAETLAGAGKALTAGAGPCWGTLEAHAARVHVYALTGRLAEGRAAVADMRRVADAMPAESGAAGPYERVITFNNYLECRLGTLREAHRAAMEAEQVLRDVPQWQTDARLYAGRAMVKAGDVETGARFALSAIGEYPHVVRTLAIGAADVVSVAPAGREIDEVAQLRIYAATAPRPWENAA